MMPIDIESPGGASTALKAALRALLLDSLPQFDPLVAGELCCDSGTIVKVSAGPPAWADVVLQFREAYRYFRVDGTNRDPTTIFGSNPDYDGSYNASGLTANGMTFSAAGNRPWAIGDLVTPMLLTNDRTYVVEYTGAVDDYPLLYWTDEVGSQFAEMDGGLVGFQSTARNYTDFINSGGRNKVAMSVDGTNLYISVNGGAATTNAHGGMQSVDRFSIGHFGDTTVWDGVVHSIVAGPRQNLGLLPQLSSLYGGA